MLLLLLSSAGPQSIDVPTGTLTVNGVSPAVAGTGSISIAVPTGTLTINGVPLVVNISQTIVIPTAIVTVNGVSPSVAPTGSASIAVPPGTLTINRLAPVIAGTGNINVAVQLGTVTISGRAPSVAGSGSVSIAIPTGTLTVTGIAPVVEFVIAVGTVDGSVLVVGPTSITSGTYSDTIYVGTVDGSTPVVGPLVFSVDSTVTFLPRVYARLFEPDGITEIAGAFDLAFNVEWFDELNGVGWGSLDMAISDANLSYATPGRMVRCHLDGMDVFTWIIEGRPQRKEVALGEESAQIAHVSGRGWLCLMDDTIVYPPCPLISPLKPTHLIYNFAHPDFPNSDTWTTSEELYDYADGVAAARRVTDVDGVLYPAPADFPWPTFGPQVIPVYWMWVTGVDESALGSGFFRFGFTLADPQPVTFTVTADNWFLLYVDGVPILGEDQDGLMWEGWKEITIPFGIGSYKVAIVVENMPFDGSVPVGTSNPAGGLLAAFVADTQGIPQQHVLTSNSQWDATFSADNPPGWTPGQIVSHFISESVARGALSYGAGSINYYFDAFADSGGNPWSALEAATTTSFVPSLAIQIGRTGLDLLDLLHEEAWVDFHMNSGGLSLDMWSAGAAPFDSGVTFAAGVNIGDLERSEARRFVNALLVTWNGLFVEVLDEASVANERRREDIYDSQATSLDEATRLGRKELMLREQSVDGAIVVEIEPTSIADTPYWAFTVGTMVTAPDETAAPVSVRCLSIAVRQDEMGDPKFTLELNRRWPVQERDASRLLRSIGGKSQGSAGDRGVI